MSTMLNNGIHTESNECEMERSKSMIIANDAVLPSAESFFFLYISLIFYRMSSYVDEHDDKHKGALIFVMCRTLEGTLIHAFDNVK